MPSSNSKSKKRKMNHALPGTTTTTSENSLQIEGFYYDNKTKRYYRLLPEHNGIHPLSLKKNTPLEKTNQKLKSKLESMVTLMDQLHLGVVNPLSFNSRTTKTRLNSLDLVHEHPSNDRRSTVSEEDSCLFLIPWNEKSHLLGVCTEAGKSSSKVCAWTAYPKEDWSETSNPKCKLSLHAHDEPLWYVNGKINEVALGEFLPNNPCLFVCSVQTQAFPVAHLVAIPLRTVLCEEDVPHRVEVFKFESNCVWSCAASKATGEIAVGMENQLITFNHAGYITDKYLVPGHNVLGLHWNNDGRVLYATTNKGLLHGYDLRAHTGSSIVDPNSCTVPRKPTFIVPLGVATHQVQPLTDDNILLLSGYDNFLELYDMRVRKPVVVYAQHDNEHKRIKASVDEGANVVSSAGQSGVVRLWHMNTGKLLKELPAVNGGGDFASTWYRGEKGPPAQITHSGTKLHVYQSF